MPPAGLAAAVTTAALSEAALTTTVVLSATKTIAMTTLQKALITVTVAALAGAGIYEARQATELRNQVQMLQQQQAPLAEQHQRLQHELEDVTKRLAAEASPKGDNAELLRLRGEVGVLTRQASDAEQRANITEQNLAAALSSKAQFEAHQSASVGALKQLGLAVRVFAGDNNNRFPTNIVQLNKELGGSFDMGGVDLFAFEWMNVSGARNVENPEHPNLVEFRERLARQAPDGSWQRIYGFVDGSVHTATSFDGNFDAWEKANTYSLPQIKDP